MNKVLNVLDIFSGIGGFSLGLEKAGMQTVAFCEINPFCQQILKKHWESIPVFPDVTKLTKEDFAGLPQIDVIAGGFPCQDISCAGKQKGIGANRSGLWKEFKRLINELKPSYAIIENVANLRGNGLITVLQDLWEIGYDAEWHCIPASTFGAPHRRDRVWIISHPVSIGKPRFSVREEEGQSTSRDSCENAPYTDCQRCWCGKYNRQGRHVQENSKREYSKIHKERDIGELGIGETCKILSNADYRQCECGRPRETDAICKKEQIVSHYRSRGIEQWGVEPESIPRLTEERLNPDWVEWLMGFPKGWTEGGSRKKRLMSLGNAVVPMIPEFLGKCIINRTSKF